jgi:pilus assembly protein CpaB
MKKRLLSVLAFALAVSAGAAFVLYQLIASKVKAGAPSPAPRTSSVFVAARDLPLGALIQERDLKTQDYIAPPTGSLTKKEDLIGRGVSNPIHEDSPFFDANLAPKGAGAGFASIIPKGMRAFAIHVNEVMGVAGFAVAGMHVDILVSGTPTGSGVAETAGPISRTLLQNIEILSAGQNFQKDAEGKPVLVQVVNLLVTPAQAEIMNLAADQKLQLVLRNPSDHDLVTTSGASTASLFDGTSTRIPGPVRSTPRPAPAPSMPAAPPVRTPTVIATPVTPSNVTVEVFAGGKKSEATFSETPGSVKP